MLRNVDFKLVYASGTDEEPIEFFYEAFLESKTLKLGLGYFSSSAIRVLAPGFAYFIANGGKMQIVINDELSEDDKDAIEKGKELNLAKIENSLLNNVRKLTELLSSDNQLFFDCLSYLIATDRMEFVATVSLKGGIAHDKYGVFEDNKGDQVGFTGSANFSANALCYNAETITCFTSWNGDSDVKRIQLYEELFDKIWDGKSKHVKIIPIDKVKILIKEKFPPKSLNQLIQESSLTRSLKQSDNFRLSHSLIEKLDRIDVEPRFPYSEERQIQINAYNAWCINNYRGIFAMATGAGKTITALNCVLKEFSKTDYYKAIIVVPTQALAIQWESEVYNFNYTNVISTYTNSRWDSELEKYVTRSIFNENENLILITTYATFNLNRFQNILSKINNVDNFTYIADEAHNLGATNSLKSLPIQINRRIGLSATPERVYDEDGSKRVFDFFQSNPPQYTYRYTMKEAIDEGILCKYNYYPVFVELTEIEMLEYKKITRQLCAYIDSETKTYKKGAEKLLLKRKRIIHKAENKKNAVNNLLDELKERKKLDYTFVFVPEGFEPDYTLSESYEIESEDVRIIDEYADMFKQKGYSYHKFISGLDDSESVLKSFADGDIQILLSMKCLDEGVDIPRAEHAIFCASTGNPRQFIQRRGRVLRKCKGKDSATIWDLIVVPPMEFSEENFNIERSLFISEVRRVVNFAALAENKLDILYGELKNKCYDLNIDLFTLLEEEEKQYLN